MIKKCECGCGKEGYVFRDDVQYFHTRDCMELNEDE